MGLFTREKPVAKIDQELLAYNKIIQEEHDQINESIMSDGMDAAIDAAVKKSFNQLAYHHGDDQSGFFGSEFNIQSTASRFKAAYTREPWVWAAANLIARTLVSVKYKVVNVNTGEESTEHPILDRINSGNDIQGPIAIKWAANLDFILGGSFLIVFDDKFQQCEHVPVERFTIEIDEAESGCNHITAFLVQSECGTKSWRVPYERCLYVVFPNPYSAFYGMSLFTAASRPIILDRVKNEFELAFYLRGATNSGVIESSEDVNKSRLKILMKSFESLFTGKRNWHRQLILPKGLTWKPTGSNFSEMNHIEGLKENRLSLLASLAVPPSKVGLTEDVNRATSEAQDKDFWENTIKPLAVFQADSINQSHIIKKMFKGIFKIVPDFSDVTSLQGSLVTKGEDAKAVEPYWTLNEIRKEIFGKSSVPDGDKLLSQMVQAPSPFGFLQAPTQSPSLELEPIKDTTASQISRIKSQVTNSQERVSNQLAKDYKQRHEKYVDDKLSLVIAALKAGKDPAQIKDQTDDYVDSLFPVMDKARERGFSFSNSQSKSLSPRVARNGRKMPTLRFSHQDQEAIDLLKSENTDGQRELLRRRMIESFAGFDETISKQIMDMIADGKARGLTDTEIAANIRQQYGEFYPNQANTVVRTEILTAVSQGIESHQDVLKEVFTEVQKQWIHVGDSGEHVRENHVGFEDEGPKEIDYEYTTGLRFPRDPDADGSETINCRCSMVNLVPDTAESNADSILARF